MRRQVLMPSLCTFFILFIHSAILQAKQQAIDITVCIAGTCDNLSDGEDSRTMSSRSSGLGWRINDYKLLETCTVFARDIPGIKGDNFPFLKVRIRGVFKKNV